MVKKELFVSNLCWKKKNLNFVIDNLKKEKITGIDFAPINYFKSWKNIKNNSRKLQILFKKKKIKVNSIQGIFFKKNLNLFNIKQKKRITDHFKLIVKLCKIFEAKKIILGSSMFRNPKNLNVKNADNYFIIYFKYLNKFLKKSGVYLCIETIPKKYKENYIFSLSHLRYLVSKINAANIKINFDTSIYHFKRFEKQHFFENLKNIKNIQISQPNFDYFDNPTKKNLKFLKALKNQKKIKKISLEIIDNNFNKLKFIKSIKKLKYLVNR